MAAGGRRRRPLRYQSLAALVEDSQWPFLFLVSDFSYAADDYEAEGHEEQKGPPEGSEAMPYIDESPTMSPQLSARSQASGDRVSPTPPEGLAPGVGIPAFPSGGEGTALLGGLKGMGLETLGPIGGPLRLRLPPTCFASAARLSLLTPSAPRPLDPSSLLGAFPCQPLLGRTRLSPTLHLGWARAAHRPAGSRCSDAAPANPREAAPGAPFLWGERSGPSGLSVHSGRE
ncbi:hypothetical protein P7K49_010185 [Saguinus oedipus]|uniref:Uncharacterized protein n=1 Tax=Saguinus oedipus TaxID=9490 RepID=A0ABQ9VNJ8_SAGOE|nr:hypothetical protein P7K49_010185 [Saguinus oedipus]